MIKSVCGGDRIKQEMVMYRKRNSTRIDKCEDEVLNLQKK